MMTKISFPLLLLALSLFYFSSSVLGMSLTLIIMAFFSFMLTSFLLSSWSALSLMLIFLGGMMVIYLYVISLASNQKIVFEWKPFLMLLLILMSTMFMVSLQQACTGPTLPSFFILNHLFSQHSVFFITALTLYLLTSLFTLMKICQCFKGALMKSK